jgi:aarF domain-containing kinase
MYLKEPRGNAKLALIDFGLVASIKQSDMDTMISCVIHLANKDYTSLVDDFIQLGILPSDCDRSKVVPLMDKALTPYVKGGGAQRYEEELRKTYGLDGTIRGNAGGFQAMTQDALTVMNDIPFSIPPYFALLGRAIVTLEGIALTGDPSYGIIMEAYPFVARKLLSEDRPEIQRALQEVLYSKSSDMKLQATRLNVLINSALGIVSKSDSSFVDFDTLPEDSASLESTLKLLLSPKAKSLRGILVEEVVNGLDIMLRSATRKAYDAAYRQLASTARILQPFASVMNTIGLSAAIPRAETIPIPLLLPSTNLMQSAVSSLVKSVFNSKDSSAVPSISARTIATTIRPQDFSSTLARPVDIVEAIAPKLTREEELYGIALVDLVKQSLGSEAALIANGDAMNDPLMAIRFLLSSLQSINDGNESQASRAIQGLLRRLQQRSESNSLSTAAGIDEIAKAIKHLNEEERIVLQDISEEVFQALSDRLISRLRTRFLVSSS